MSDVCMGLQCLDACHEGRLTKISQHNIGLGRLRGMLTSKCKSVPSWLRACSIPGERPLYGCCSCMASSPAVCAIALKQVRASHTQHAESLQQPAKSGWAESSMAEAKHTSVHAIHSACLQALSQGCLSLHAQALAHVLRQLIVYGPIVKRRW